jgi:hypothetical protein
MYVVDLYGASKVAGSPVCGAQVRALNGSDELANIEHPKATSIQFTSRLLDSCVEWLFLADADAVPARGVTDQLSVGDREVLVLTIRSLTFGDKLDLVLDCPSPECSLPMDLVLSIKDLLDSVEPPTNLDTLAWHDYSVRPLTGVDLHLVAATSPRDPSRTEQLLAQRCIDHTGNELRDSDCAEIASLLEYLDPHSYHGLVLRCPECGTSFESSVDAADLLRGDLIIGQSALDYGIHLLANNYHWSLAEILSLPTMRRQSYARILTEQFLAVG